ncbi:MAG: response regulator [Candidatus Zixiibacteriota bacterium]
MQNKKTILIVEDETDLVEFLSVFFKEQGYNTIAAFDGRDGYLKAETEHPDLITLDVSMPGESGIKMYHNLIHSEKTKNIPVVILTGAPSELKTFIARMKSFPNPAGYLEKPVDHDALLKTVKDLIG